MIFEKRKKAKNKIGNQQLSYISALICVILWDMEFSHSVSHVVTFKVQYNTLLFKICPLEVFFLNNLKRMRSGVFRSF